MTCPQCGTLWEFSEQGRAECANGHQWDQAPAIPGTFVRPGYPGDINDPERFPEEGTHPPSRPVPLYPHVIDDGSTRWENTCASSFGDPCDCLSLGYPHCILDAP